MGCQEGSPPAQEETERGWTESLDWCWANAWVISIFPWHIIKIN